MAVLLQKLKQNHLDRLKYNNKQKQKQNGKVHTTKGNDY